MNVIEETIEATLDPNGQLRLTHPPRLPPGPVRVTIRVAAPVRQRRGMASWTSICRRSLRLPVSASRDAERTDLMVWIDTAFNVGLALPRKQVAKLGLSQQSSSEAILADGRCVELEAFACLLDWFGKT